MIVLLKRQAIVSVKTPPFTHTYTYMYMCVYLSMIFS